jgi:serine/threonine protein kinase
LAHAHVVRLLGVAQDADSVYIFLEAVLAAPPAGALNLRQLLRELPNESLPPPPAALIASGLASALQHLYGRRVAHRDVKPENIALRPAGEPVLIDFGAARAVPADGRLQSLCGTVAYCAPEMLGRQPHGREVD